MMEDDIIAFFVHQKALSLDHVPILHQEKSRSRKTLLEIAVDFGFITKEESIRLSADFFKMPYVNLSLYSLNDFEEANALIRDFKACIFKEDDKELHIGVEDPLDILLKDNILQILTKKRGIKKNIEWYFANIDQHFNYALVSLDESVLSDLEHLFQKAVRSSATDIHLKALDKTFCCYFRIHGDLIVQKTWPKSDQLTITNRLKIFANLDIAQTRTAQSGSFLKKIDNRNIHFRMSTHPTLHGESLAIRVLDLFKTRLKLDELGILEDHLKALKNVLTQDEGLILLTGPTGSGKTTTLYACLDFLSDKKLNIMTLEDPIECQLDFATQTEVNVLFNFESGIKSILRQDPDVILIGEIRDEKTAHMAFRAAMTGHLVLSTLHTQSVNTIVERLEDLKISQHLIKTFLKLGLQQKFVKEKTAHCCDEKCQICYGMTMIDRKIKTEIKIF
ncbi:MAG: hypothetical protein HEEMFOPI_00576 [Holosporales bacterium]